jgi:energy-coupling factor transporter ATP-binding protein EcfA2
MLTIPVWFIEKVSSSVLELLSARVKKIADEELSEKINNICSDKAFSQDILIALDAAANKFLKTYSDREIARYLTTDMRFYDLGSIQQATREFIAHPYSVEQINDSIKKDFESVLPQSLKPKAKDAADYFVELLREQLISVFKAHDVLKLFFQLEELKTHQQGLQISREQLDVSRQVRDSLKPSLLSLRFARISLVEYNIAQNKYIDPRGIIKTSHPISLPLEKIYVPLIADDEIETSQKHSSRHKVDDSIDNDDDYKQVFGNLPLAIKRYNKLVILGEPGSGKTTLLRLLTYLFSSAYHLKIKYLENKTDMIDNDGNNYGHIGIPFYLRVSKYADCVSQSPNKSLWNFIEDSIQEIGIPGNVSKDLVVDIFDKGEAIVLLDGLDEILEISQRIDIGQQIEKLISAKPNNRYIISSRIVGYRNAPLSGSFAHFTLREFGKDQILQFLSRWCPQAERAYSPNLDDEELAIRTQKEIEGILQAIDENIGIKRLSTTPLMLTVLALAHHQKGRMPARRIELYEFAIKVLFEDWEVAHGISDKKIIRETEALRLLGPLAYWMHDSKPQGIATEHEVKNKLAEILSISRGTSLDDQDIQDAVDNFLLKVQERTGVFQKIGQDYGFVHQTFEEYFCARDIARRHKDAIQRVYQYRHASRWEEPILLAIGFMSKDYPEDAEDLIMTSIMADSPLAEQHNFRASNYEDILHRDLLFAVKCIGDTIGLNLNFSKGLIDKIVKIYFDVQGHGKYKPLRDLILANLANIRGSDVADYVVDHFISAIDPNNFPEYIKECYFISKTSSAMSDSIQNPRITSGFSKSFSDTVVEAAIIGLGQIGIDTPRVISVLDTIYKTNPNLRMQALKILKDFGIKRRPSAATGILGILPGSLDESMIHTDEFKLPDLNRPEALPSLLPYLDLPYLDYPFLEIRVRIAIAIVHISGYYSLITPDIRTKIVDALYEGLTNKQNIKSLKSSKESGTHLHDIIWDALWDITGS